MQMIGMPLLRGGTGGRLGPAGMLMRAILPSSVGTSMLPPAWRTMEIGAAMDVGALALEQLMVAHREEDVEIARRPAARSRLASPEPDARAVLDAGRDVDLQRLVAMHPAWATQRGTACRSHGRRQEAGQVRSTVKKPRWPDPPRPHGLAPLRL